MGPVVWIVRLIWRQPQDIAPCGATQPHNGSIGVVEIGAYLIDLEDFTIFVAQIPQFGDHGFAGRHWRPS